MASRRGDTFDKRQRERRRQEKAAVKRAKRQGQEVGPRPNTRTAPRTSAENDAMEKFRILSEHHAAGGIDDDTFQFMRAEIFGELGIEPPGGAGEQAKSDPSADDAVEDIPTEKAS